MIFLKRIILKRIVSITELEIFFYYQLIYTFFCKCVSKFLNKISVNFLYIWLILNTEKILEIFFCLNKKKNETIKIILKQNFKNLSKSIIMGEKNVFLKLHIIEKNILRKEKRWWLKIKAKQYENNEIKKMIIFKANLKVFLTIKLWK